MTWDSVNGFPFSPYGGRRHLRHVRNVLEYFAPEIVWASSDAWHAYVAQHACRPARIPYVVDLYDNYESFGMTRMPFVRGRLRSSCRRAQGVTTVTSTLKDYVQNRYHIDPGRILVLGNAVNPDTFSARPRDDARRHLGLPQDAILIGTAGNLGRGRDIRTLFEALPLLRRRWADLRLVVAGPRDDVLSRYVDDGLIDLGVLPTDRVPVLFSALDVGVISNRDSSFGRYCYPQKYQEMLACGLPMVAADVGEMRTLLQDYPERLYTPGSARSLAEAVNSMLCDGNTRLSAAVFWTQRAVELSAFLEECLAEGSQGVR